MPTPPNIQQARELLVNRAAEAGIQNPGLSQDDFLAYLVSELLVPGLGVEAIATAIVGDETALAAIQNAAPSVVALASVSNAVAVDLSAGRNFKLTLGEDSTLSAPTNPVEGQSGVISIAQDGTGSRTLAYNVFWNFAGGVVPDLSTTADAVDHLSYYVEPGALRARVQLSKEDA